MNARQLAAFLAFFGGGIAAGMTGSALLREIPGAKSFYVDRLDIRRSLLPDGGDLVTAEAYAAVTVGLGDGGISVVRPDSVSCALTGPQTTQLRTILTAAGNCVRDAP